MAEPQDDQVRHTHETNWCGQCVEFGQWLAGNKPTPDPLRKAGGLDECGPECMCCPNCVTPWKCNEPHEPAHAARPTTPDPLREALVSALQTAHRPHHPSCAQDRYPGNYMEPADPCTCGLDDLLVRAALEEADRGDL